MELECFWKVDIWEWGQSLHCSSVLQSLLLTSADKLPPLHIMMKHMNWQWIILRASATSISVVPLSCVFSLQLPQYGTSLLKSRAHWPCYTVQRLWFSWWSWEPKSFVNKKSFIRTLWQEQWAKEEEEEAVDGGGAPVLTVTAMNLKGSIIATRAHRHRGRRGGDTKSSMITEEGGTWGKQML